MILTFLAQDTGCTHLFIPLLGSGCLVGGYYPTLLSQQFPTALGSLVAEARHERINLRYAQVDLNPDF